MPLKTVPKKCLVLFFIAYLSIAFQFVAAQSRTDSTHTPRLTSLEELNEPSYVFVGPNVVFPEILSGNEEEMLPYIKKFSSKRRDYLIRMYTRGKVYLPKATTILEKYSLPKELNVLLPLESAYNGNAVSKVGAVGYWQIMDEVAKEYGLKYVKYVSQRSKAEKKKQAKVTKREKQPKTIVKIKDDRKNFNKSTHAAARYLSDRRRNLDDNWLLIVASYNCGIGNVWNAMKRSGISNPTFWDIKDYLPAETRAYVMNFITLNVIFNNYELFVKNKLNFETEKVILPNTSEMNKPGESGDYSNR